MTEGVLYIATSEALFDMAERSAETLKNNNNVETSVIITDEIKQSHNPSHLFDNIIIPDKVYNDIRDKIYNLDKSPYDKTIFIDADTLVLEDISGIFKLLDRVDLAAPHAQARPVVTIKDVPEAFTELSTAVVGYKNNSRLSNFFKQWKLYHERQMKHGRPDESVTLPHADTLEEASSFGPKHGQPPFREALYFSDIKYHVLPTEYLFRSSSFAYNKVKILHYRSRKRGEKVAKIINKDIENRYLINWMGKLYRENSGTKRISYPFIESLASNKNIHRILKYLGMYETARKLYLRLF